MSKTKWTQLGALWARTARNNMPYLSGQITLPDGYSFNVTVWPNGYKSDDSHPDLVIQVREEDLADLAGLIRLPVEDQIHVHPF